MSDPSQPFGRFEDLPPQLQAFIKAQLPGGGEPPSDEELARQFDELNRAARPPMNQEQRAELQQRLQDRRDERRRVLEEMRQHLTTQPAQSAEPAELTPEEENVLAQLPEHLQQQARSFYEERRAHRPPGEEQLARDLAGRSDDELRNEWELLLNQRKAAMDTRSEDAARTIGLRLQRVYEAMKLHGFADQELDQRVEQWSFETIAQKQLVPDWAVHSGSAMPVKQRSYRLYAHDYAVEFSTFLLGDGRWLLGTYTGTFFNILDTDEDKLLAWARQFFWLLALWIKIAGVPTSHYLPDLILHEQGWEGVAPPAQRDGDDGDDYSENDDVTPE